MCIFGTVERKVRKLSDVEGDDGTISESASFETPRMSFKKECTLTRLSMPLRTVVTLWFIQDPYPHFRGRVDIVDKLHETISRPAKGDVRGNSITILKGSSGIGKSQVAKQFAKIYGQRNFDENILYIKADTFESIINSFNTVAKILRILPIQNQSIPLHEHVYKFFATQKLQCLIVFDKVQHYKHFKGTHENGIDYFLPKNPSEYHKYHPRFLLLTSQLMKDTDGVQNLRTLEMESLKLEDSRMMMVAFLKITDLKKVQLLHESADVKKLHEKLQGYPLALELALGYIRSEEEFETRNSSMNYPKQFLQGFIDYNEYLSKTVIPPQQSISEQSDRGLLDKTTSELLQAVWKRSLQSLEKKEKIGSLCTELLQIISLMDPMSITVGFLYVIHFRVKASDHIRVTSVHFKSFEEAISLLESYGLISSPTSRAHLERFMEVDANPMFREILQSSADMSGSDEASNFEFLLKHHRITVHELIQKLIRQTFSNVVPRVVPVIADGLMEIPRQAETFLGSTVFTLHDVINKVQKYSQNSLQTLTKLGWKFRHSFEVRAILEDVFDIAAHITDSETMSDEELFNSWLYCFYAEVKDMIVPSEKSMVALRQTIYELKGPLPAGELIKFVLKYAKAFLERSDDNLLRLAPILFSSLAMLMDHWKFDRISMGLIIQLTLVATEFLSVYLLKEKLVDEEHSILGFVYKISTIPLLPTTMRLQILKTVLNVMVNRDITRTFHPPFWVVLKNVMREENVIHNFFQHGGVDVFLAYWKNPTWDFTYYWDDTWSSFDAIVKLIGSKDKTLRTQVLAEESLFLDQFSKIQQANRHDIVQLACALVFLFIIKDAGNSESTAHYLLFENVKYVIAKEFIDAFVSVLKNYYCTYLKFNSVYFIQEMPSHEVKKVHKMVANVHATIVKGYHANGMQRQEYETVREDLDNIFKQVNSYITQEVNKH